MTTKEDDDKLVVEVPDEPKIEIEIAEAAPAEPELPLAPPAAKIEPELEALPPPPEPGDGPATLAPAAPDPVAELTAQLQRLQAQAQRERQGREEAEREVVHRTTEARASRIETANARLHAIVNAIAAEKNEAEIAESVYAKASSEQDYTEAAKQQRIIARCESRIAQMEDGRAELDAWLKSPQRQRDLQPRPAPTSAPARQDASRAPEASVDPVEDFITGQSQRNQAYLRSRDRTWLSDTDKNQKLRAAHNLALIEGYAEESPGYYAFIDDKMGHASGLKTEVPKKKEPVKAAKAATPAAPVSQKSAPGSQSASAMRVQLTPGQVQAAKDLGIPLTEYAKRVWKMQQPDWNGPKFGGQG